MSRIFIAVLLVVFVSSVSGVTVASAQSSSTRIQFGPLPGVQTLAGAPGSTVDIPISVIGSAGIMPRVDMKISVPSPLQVLDTSYCSAETAHPPEQTVFTPKPCRVVGWSGANSSQLISTEIDGLGTVEAFRVSATLVLHIPEDVPVGSEFTISTLHYDFFGDPSKIKIVIIEDTSDEISPAAPSVQNVTPAKPLYDIDGSALEFSVGSIRPFGFEINYDAYPEATSASLTLYASTGIIDVTDPTVVDWDASYTCGASGAATSRSLQRPKRSLAVLPTFFNLSLPRWMDLGMEVQVCAEVVYYNGSKVIGVERYMSVITVQE